MSSVLSLGSTLAPMLCYKVFFSFLSLPMREVHVGGVSSFVALFFGFGLITRLHQGFEVRHGDDLSNAMCLLVADS